MDIRRVSVVILLAICLFTIITSCSAAPTAPKPAEFQVNNLQVNPSEVDQSQTITVSAEIKNIGGIYDDYTAILNVDGKERDKKIVNVKPSESKLVIFSVMESSIGQHEVSLGSAKSNFNVAAGVIALKHDNNVCSYAWMMPEPWGLWIRFDAPTTPFEIRKIYIRGFRSDSPMAESKFYTIKIWDGNFNKQLYSYDYPYTNFLKNAKTVDHDINPPIIVKGTFIVEIISQSEWNDQTQTSKDARIYVCTDSTVDSRQDIGISSGGRNDEDMYQRQILMEPRFSHAAWIIRVEGKAKK